ncbi:MAG: hypothetical protein ACREL1_03090 [bacterium]
MNRFKSLSGFLARVLNHQKVRRAVWAALIAGTVDLLLFCFFWMPAALDHHGLEKSIGGYRRAKLESEKSQETARVYEDLNRRSLLLSAKWKAPATQASLVESVTRIASRRHLKVLAQDFEMKKSPGGGTDFEQNLSLSGGYGALREFLDDLDNLPTLTLVRQARLERGSSLTGEMRATLLLSTYRQSSPEGGS